MWFIKTCIVALLGLVWSSGVLAIPDIQHWTTDQGTTVYFVAADELPMIDIRVVFDAGSARDGDQPGLAEMTLDMLANGAGGMSTDEISTAFESLGAQYGVSLDRDIASVQLRSLVDKDKLEPALTTLRKVIAEPEFPQNDFKREQQRTLIGLQAKKQSPGALASDAFYKAMYHQHPYAHPTAGTDDSVINLTRNDLVAFHKRYYTAGNATVAIVGAVTRQEAERIAAELVQDLPRGEPPAELPEVGPINAEQVQIEYPSSQTHLLIGMPVLRRHDTDYFPLYVGNHVLGGGGLVSRLFDSIRERHGLSYSVYSYFLPKRQAGPFMAGLQTNTDRADEALALLREEIRRYIKAGPTPEELESTKKNITGGFPLRIASNSSIVEYLAMIGFYGLPLDYLDTFNDKVEAVTIEQIRDAFQRRLNVDDFVTVRVGRKDDAASRSASSE